MPPAESERRHPTSVAPFDAVIFGGRGDLAMRKLLPALYQRHASRELPADGRVFALGRSAMDDAGYRKWADQHCQAFIGEQAFDPHEWGRFLQRLHYVSVDAGKAQGYAALRDRLQAPPDPTPEQDPVRELEPDRVRMFYLATSPDLFVPTCRGLHHAGLVTPNSRVVLEKPLGHDLDSARAINAAVGECFAERQIYRIDHYLGKETVQNLMALRFGNALFEPMWRRDWVQNVQITVAEALGVGTRGGYYDTSGALRDMIQNHLLQVLCLIAMEPPASLDPDAVRDEKLKVLRALAPLRGADALAHSVRGQYRAGTVANAPVPGYLEESGIPRDSDTETFAALRVQIDNWRWSGVPFYLRTGKRLAVRASEIVINFREVPHHIFGSITEGVPGNRLVIRLQPDESVRLHLMAKARGDHMTLRPVSLDLDFATTYRSRAADAYEPLLMDVLRGKPTLFMRRDEVDAAWTWCEPILAAWAGHSERVEPYPAGSWGPPAADRLVERDGFHWHHAETKDES